MRTYPVPSVHLPHLSCCVRCLSFDARVGNALAPRTAGKLAGNKFVGETLQRCPRIKNILTLSKIEATYAHRGRQLQRRVAQLPPSLGRHVRSLTKCCQYCAQVGSPSAQLGLTLAVAVQVRHTRSNPQLGSNSLNHWLTAVWPSAVCPLQRQVLRRRPLMRLPTRSVLLSRMR